MNRIFALSILALATAAAIRPAWTAGAPAANNAREAAVVWPAFLEGAPLVPTPLLPLEARLAADFPGNIAAFEADGSRVVMRRIAQPTRQLHPVETCLRAGGYRVTPRPAFRHPESGLWGVVQAAKSGQSFRVRETVRSADGRTTWTDVSAWYWDALLHPDRGPWLAITAIEPPAHAH